MPFRERAKNLFKTKSRGDSLSKTDTNTSSTTDRERYPSNVYKPGEPMPKPKYRRPPQKEHKDKLEAFNFADAWRKKSFQSSYSPMGTRAPSRRNSLFSLGRKSVGSRSMAGKSEAGRTASMKSGETDQGAPPTAGMGRQREGLGAAVAPTLTEQEGDDNVANVGLSRVHSRERAPLSRPRTAEEQQRNGQPNALYQTITARDHQPFTAAEIEQALKKSQLQIPTQA